MSVYLLEVLPHFSLLNFLCVANSTFVGPLPPGAMFDIIERLRLTECIKNPLHWYKQRGINFSYIRSLDDGRAR